MDSSSLLTSLLTSLAIFVVLMLLYTQMAKSSRNAVMYYSNRILKGMDPWEGYGSRPRSPFSWIKEALSSSEADMIAISGVDTAVYFVFLSTGYGLELSRFVPIILYRLKLKYICKTFEDAKEAWAPGDLGYETRFPGDMLIATIVLCYSVIAPLILPFGIAYFALGWVILRNQALKVYVPTFESYGRMWPHIHTRLIGALLLFQVTMVGYSGVKEFYYTPILILPPIVTLVFASVCKNKFYNSFKFFALESAAQELRCDPNMEQIVQHFIPLGLKSPNNPDEHESEDIADAFSI